MRHKIKPALLGLPDGTLGGERMTKIERMSRLEVCELFYLAANAPFVKVVVTPWLKSYCIVNQDGLILARPFSYLEMEELPE